MPTKAGSETCVPSLLPVSQQEEASVKNGFVEGKAYEKASLQQHRRF